MSTPSLFTVKIYHLPNINSEPVNDSSVGLKYLEEFYNMLSAKVVKGRFVEMDHAGTIGWAINFKTVVNYTRHLAADSSLGVILVPQGGYIMKEEPSSSDHDSDQEQNDDSAQE